MQRSQQLKVTSNIKRMIAEGKYSPGDRLPTENELTAILNVSRGTVRKGLHELVTKGILEQKHSVGCFVSNIPMECSVEQTKQYEKAIFLAASGNGKFNFQLVDGIESVLFQHGMELVVHNIMIDTFAKIEQILERISPSRCAGIIFSPIIHPNYHEINNRILDLFDRAGINYVVVDSPITENGIIRGNFVGSDGYSAEREIVKKLIKAGHTRIGSIRVFNSVYTADQRFNGICDELRCQGLSLEPGMHTIIEDAPIAEQGRQRIQEILALHNPPTAIICSHDVIAINVIDELKRIGRKVPEDISVVGFDDEDCSSMLHLSTVRQPFREIGMKAVEILLFNQKNGRRQDFLPCLLVERDTVAQKKISGEKTDNGAI